MESEHISKVRLKIRINTMKKKYEKKCNKIKNNHKSNIDNKGYDTPSKTNFWYMVQI